jgi:AraC family transcriptional regulator
MPATATVVPRQNRPLDASAIYAAGLHNLGPEHYSTPAAREARTGARLTADITPDVSAKGRSVSTGGLAPWQVKKVTQYIEARISHAIPLDELAQQVRLSTSYFSTAFKTTFGIPPHSYIVSCRVDHAKRRMLDSEAPLCEIALDCGLADQSHLSRVFRRVTGTTPSAWRRRFTPGDAMVPIQ